MLAQFRANFAVATTALLMVACGSESLRSALPGQRQTGITPDPLPSRPNSQQIASAFPRGFLWGVATAGHQTEGNDTTSQWAKWAQDGKTAQLPGRATDSWIRFGEDFDLAKGMALNAFRFSIEWSRVEPKPGYIDRRALEHYSQMVDAAHSRGLEPVVTLHHFTYPSWLDTYKQQTGGYPGWEDPYTAVQFANYARLIARSLRGRVRYYITLNEPNMQGMLGYLAGLSVPGKRNATVFSTVMANFAKGHALAYDAIHSEDPRAQVSTNVFRMPHARDADTLFPVDPAEDFLDKIFAWKESSPPLLPIGMGTGPTRGLRKLDFVSFDYYFSYRWAEVLRLATQWDWPIQPEGLYTSLRYYRDRYHMPILIAENGIATEDEKPRRDGWSRAAFLVNHIWQVRLALADGIDVLGYLHWSLLDNYEWGSFKSRFGLYHVDYDNPGLPRRPTPAVQVYRDIAAGNDVNAALASRYLGKKN